MTGEVEIIKPRAPMPPQPNSWDYRANLVGEIATWQPPLTSADHDIRPGFEINKARARDLMLTNPYAVNSAEILRDAVVGKKFILALTPNYEALNITAEASDEWTRLVEDEWDAYAEGITFDADVTRHSTFTFMMHQVLVGLHTEGEALGLVVGKVGQFGYATALQLLEPERLDNYHQVQSRLAGQNEVRYGVERDVYGEAVAYHIRNAHPHDAIWSGGMQNAMVQRIERYSADGRPQVLHLFDKDRPGMTRGVSKQMLSSLKNMKMLSTFSDAELSRQIQSASWAAVIETDLDHQHAMKLLGQNVDLHTDTGYSASMLGYMRNVAPYYAQAGMRYNGSQVVHLMPNEKLKIVQSQLQGAQYDIFEKAFLRQLAAGLNVSYESLTRDYSDMSYSAARASSEDAWRRYLRIRQMLTQQFCMPFFSAWLEEALMERRLPMPGKYKPTNVGWMSIKHHVCKGDFVSWGRPIIDPVKERTGQGLALAMGLTTMRKEAAAEGEDFAEMLKQRRREADLREKLDLNPTGVDPTLVIGGNGAPPDAEGEGGGGGKKKAGNPQESRKARRDGPG